MDELFVPYLLSFQLLILVELFFVCLFRFVQLFRILRFCVLYICRFRRDLCVLLLSDVSRCFNLFCLGFLCFLFGLWRSGFLFLRFWSSRGLLSLSCFGSQFLFSLRSFITC